MTPVKLICMDMDGTLLCGLPPTLPEENRQALREAHAAGIQLALASGRCPADAGTFAEKMGVPMHVIALNGGYIEIDGKEAQCTPFSPEDARKICDIVKNSGLYWGMFSRSVLCVSHAYTGPDCVEYWGHYMYARNNRIFFDCTGTEELLADGLCKVVAMDPDGGNRLEKMIAAIKAAVPGLEYASSWKNNVEINPHGVEKGMAVAALAEKLRIPLENVMCLGDNGNDVPMLKVAGYGVAMENATDSAKDASNWLAPANTDFGVAVAIRELALEGKAELIKPLR